MADSSRRTTVDKELMQSIFVLICMVIFILVMIGLTNKPR